MPVSWTSERIDWVRTRARDQGFDLAGVASAPASSDPSGASSSQHFATWIAEGHAGEMDYLKRQAPSGQLLRSSAQEAMPWARSVVVCALNYNLAGPAANAGQTRSLDPAPTKSGWIARYAWTAGPNGAPLDYHDDLLRRLRPIETSLQETTGCQTRCYVDTGPVLERDFAARAGIGWIGKNTCVLNQEFGSWILLGVIVTSLPVAVQVQLAPDRCGSCTRCIDACPTDALLPVQRGEARQMDASRCIAYLTIEKKGDIATELSSKMGRQIFGCDICQEVCPWNRSAPLAETPGLVRRDELVNPGLTWLAGLDNHGFKQLFAGSPLERTRRPRFQRNIAIAMGNSGDMDFIPTLQQWAQDTLEPVRQQAARWALAELERRNTGSASIEPGNL